MSIETRLLRAETTIESTKPPARVPHPELDGHRLERKDLLRFRDLVRKIAKSRIPGYRALDDENDWEELNEAERTELRGFIARARIPDGEGSCRRSGITDWPSLGQKLSHLGEQGARTVWLSDVSVAACRQCLRLVAGQRIRCHCDNGYTFQLRVRPDAPCGLISIHDWQLDVHQDQVGTLLCQCGERFLAVLGFNQVESGVSKKIAQYLPIVGLILNHQDAIGHRPSPVVALVLAR